MGKFKKVLFMVAIVAALVMSSCSGKHKNYIPGDSKVVGKLDLKEFFIQSGIDREKLMADIADAFGDDAGIEDCGLDLAEPVYFFANTKGNNTSGGAIIKVDDAKKAKDWISDKMKKDLDDKEDNYEYYAESDFAAGINDDVLVFVFVDGNKSKAKNELRKVINQESDVDLGDNEVFQKMENSEGFACVYADMSIIPAEVTASNKTASDVRKMTMGVDASYKDGICDIECQVTSDDEKIQKKIDKGRSMFKNISAKAAEMLPKDSPFGVLLNAKGSNYAELIKDFVNDMGQRLTPEIKAVIDVINKIDGDIVYYCADVDALPLPRSYGSEMGQMCLIVESDDFTNDIVDLLSDSNNDNYNEDDSALAYEDEYGYGDSYSYSSGPSLEETANGYCIDNSAWFGYSNGAMWFTTKDKKIVPFEKADDPVPSFFTDFVKDHCFVLYVNLASVKSLKSQLGSKEKRQLNAFSEFFDKTKFITLSMK